MAMFIRLLSLFTRICAIIEVESGEKKGGDTNGRDSSKTR